MADRNEMLEKYIENDLLKSLSDLSEVELKKATSFSTDSGDPLVEALKKMIFSYCHSDANITTLKNVNVVIEKMFRG